jgi:hypothetical protein
MDFSELRAYGVASKLDIGLDGVCLACLSFVAIPLDLGEVDEARGALRRMTPDIWSDGLEEPALDAVRRAVADGVYDSEHALADLEERGGRSHTARAIVYRLAEQLVEQMRKETSLRARARARLSHTLPELN